MLCLSCCAAINGTQAGTGMQYGRMMAAAAGAAMHLWLHPSMEQLQPLTNNHQPASRCLL